MDSNGGNSSQNSSQRAKIQQFIEALKASREQRSEDAPIRTQNHESLGINNQEKERINQFHQARVKEWNTLYSVRERETARRIEEIKQEIKALSKQVKKLDHNLEKAVLTPVTQSTIYELSYLEHLKETLHIFTLKASHANNWLNLYLNRSKKIGHYWSGAKSGGTSYTQSGERVIATSVG